MEERIPFLGIVEFAPGAAGFDPNEGRRPPKHQLRVSTARTTAMWHGRLPHPSLASFQNARASPAPLSRRGRGDSAHRIHTRSALLIVRGITLRNADIPPLPLWERGGDGASANSQGR